MNKRRTQSFQEFLNSPQYDRRICLAFLLFHRLEFFFRFAPRAGPIEGGTHVVVSGRDFAGGNDYKCRFGGKEVQGIFRFHGGRLAAMSKKSKGTGAGARGVGAGTGGGRRVCRLTHGGHCRITSYERKGGMDGMDEMDEMDRWDEVGKRRVKIKLPLHR